MTIAVFPSRRSGTDRRRLRTVVTAGLVAVTVWAVTLGSGWVWPVSAAPTIVLNEDWASCTPIAGSTLYPVASAAPQLTGGTAQIPIKTHQASPAVECPGWEVTGNTQTWLSDVYDGTTSSALVTSQRGIYLNEGYGSVGPGQIKRTLSGLRPGAFYEIVVEAWRDASNADTYLNILVVSGAYSRPLTLSFGVNSNGVQTISGQFDVGAPTAVVTLTGGTQTQASPIVKSVVIRSVIDDNPEVTDVSATAVAPAQRTLTFDANGGTCNTATKTDVDGSWVATPGKSDCSRPGYLFKAWNTSKDGSGSGFEPGASVQLTGDNTLFAQWSKVNVTAVNDTAVAVKGRPVTGSLTLNDTFPAGSTFTVVSGTTRGTVVVNPDGTFTYTPTQAPRATTRSRG